MYSFSDILSLIMVVSTVLLPPPPAPAPPAGFAWLTRLPNEQTWQFMDQSYGGVYGVDNNIGTDGCATCVALYVRLAQNECYVAHIDSSMSKLVTNAQVDALAAAARSHWESLGVVPAQNPQWFVAAGSGDRNFARGIAQGIKAALGNAEPILSWDALNSYYGFIYPSQQPQSTPILIVDMQRPENYNWKAVHVNGQGNMWTLKEVEGAITFEI